MWLDLCICWEGKVDDLKIISGNPILRDISIELRQNWEVSCKLMEKLEAFICPWNAPK